MLAKGKQHNVNHQLVNHLAVTNHSKVRSVKCQQQIGTKVVPNGWNQLELDTLSLAWAMIRLPSFAWLPWNPRRRGLLGPWLANPHNNHHKSRQIATAKTMVDQSWWVSHRGSPMNDFWWVLVITYIGCCCKQVAHLELNITLEENNRIDGCLQSSALFYPFTTMNDDYCNLSENSNQSTMIDHHTHSHDHYRLLPTPI